MSRLVGTLAVWGGVACTQAPVPSPMTMGETGCAAAGTCDTGAPVVPPPPPDPTGDTGMPPVVEPCPEGEVTLLEGRLLDDRELDARCTYTLRGDVNVGEAYFFADEDLATVDTAVLTIPAATTLLAEPEAQLVVERGSQLFVNGTVEAPVVMTSASPEGQRAPGDWAGLVIGGRAPRSLPYPDALPASPTGLGGHGGPDPDDSSGRLSYLRIEFAGQDLSSTPLTNSALQLWAVGRATDIHHVQVHRNANTGVRVTGGTVELKHLVNSASEIRGLQWSDGWTGKAQWLVLQLRPAAGLLLHDGIIGAGSNGPPVSQPTISNATIVGHMDTAFGYGTSVAGLTLRDGTAGALSNLLILGWDGADGSCIEAFGETTSEQVDAGTLTLSYVRFDCASDVYDFPYDPLDVSAWLQSQTSVEAASLADVRDAMQDLSAPDFATDRSGGVTPPDPFFDASDVLGAVSPQDDWLSGWTAFPAN